MIALRPRACGAIGLLLVALATPATAQDTIPNLMPRLIERQAQVVPIPFDAAGSISADSARQLEQVAMTLMAQPLARITVRGHASLSGRSEAEARRVALERAIQVRRFLVGNGVAEHRVHLRGEPGDGGGTPAERVDVIVTPDLRDR